MFSGTSSSSAESVRSSAVNGPCQRKPKRRKPELRLRSRAAMPILTLASKRWARVTGSSQFTLRPRSHSSLLPKMRVTGWKKYELRRSGSLRSSGCS